MHPVIVTICGDPGGANAMVPVLQLLQQEHRVQTIHYTYNQAVEILNRQHIENQALPQKVTEDFTLQCLQNHKAVLLLTATSVNGSDWEKLFIAGARKFGIPSFSILDFWSNYTARFSDAAGTLCYLPDRIAVMDEHAKQEMVMAGIPAERILITGQPAFDALKKCREQFSPAKKQALRSSLGVDEEDLLILFASQPLRQLYGDASEPQSLGYDEQSVLEQLIPLLEMLSQKHQKNIHLLIRPHPRETELDYAGYHSSQINIQVSMEGDSRDYIMAADLILGMTTILLVEACYLNAVVLSLQPELRKQDSLPTNALGISIPIYHRHEIGPLLEKYLFDQPSRQAILEKQKSFQPPEEASRRIVDYFYLATEKCLI